MLLSVQNLEISAAGQPLVQNVSFQLAAGQCLALVGESGSGKTLSALSVMGLLPQNLNMQAQAIQFNQHNLLNIPSSAYRKLRGREMAMIFQEPLSALNPVQKAGVQVAEMFRIHAPLRSHRAEQQRVLQLLEDVQLHDPARIARSYIHQLSGGQRQRVMIAMAMALQPKLLIADEPTTALDASVQQDILHLIQKLQKSHNMGLLLISHDLNLVQHMADDIAVMSAGHVVEQGAIGLLKKPRAAYTQKLLAASPTLNLKPIRPPVTGPEVLRVTSLSKAFPQGYFWQRRAPVQALADINFSLRAGETLGIVGETGSGKSTLAKCLLQLEKPDAGAVWLGKQNLCELSPPQLRQAWQDIQMVFQDPFASLNPRRTVAASITEGLAAHGMADKATRQQKCAEILQAVDLPPAAARRYPHAFSGGQRQRIGLARALILHPRIIIADEAVSALDVSVQKQVLDLMQKIQQQYQLSYLFITHDLRVVSQIADRLLVLHHGRIVEEGPTHQVLSQPTAAYTKLLIEALV